MGDMDSIETMMQDYDRGLRVMRGPAWKWQDQDGGEGHAGTIIRPFRKKGGLGPRCPSRARMVQWDNGSRGMYRVGKKDSECDLRELDMDLYRDWWCRRSTFDVPHAKVWCDGDCGSEEIYGLRWRCTECFAVDLCTDCYMNGQHDLTHQFLRVRFSIESSKGPKMPPRSTSERIEVRGIFPGARVVEYRHKRKAVDQVSMKVIRDKNPFKKRRKSKIHVTCRGKEKCYKVGSSNVRVPVACTLDASGGWVYPDHLPVITSKKRGSSNNDRTPDFENDLEESYGDHDDMFPGNVIWRATVAYRQEFCSKQKRYKNLTAAMRSSDVGAVRKILDKNPELVHFETAPGISLICYAASRSQGNVKMMKLLLERGANIESKGVRWMTPLMISTIFKDHKMVKFLLDQGADVDANSWDNINSLYVACAQSDVKCARHLIQHGADVNANGWGNMSAFHEACRRDSCTILDMFLDRTDTDFKGQVDLCIVTKTCLHVAVEAKNAYAVSRIIQRVPRLVDMKDHNGITPLFTAALWNASKCAEILIKMGRCNINACNPTNGESALTTAILSESFDVVGVLVSNGADINLPPKTGYRTLQAAMGIRKVKPDNYGYLPFLTEMKEKWRHIGIETDGDALLAYIVDKGASLHPKDNGGYNPTIQLLLTGDFMADAIYDIWPPTRRIISTDGDDSDDDDSDEAEEIDLISIGRRRRGGRNAGSSQPVKKCRLN